MGQNICQEQPLSHEMLAQHENQPPKEPPSLLLKLQPVQVTESNEPHPLFATPLESTNFRLSAELQRRLIQLKPFIYPQGADVPKGEMLKNQYLLNNGAIYAGDWKAGKMNGKGFFVLPDKSILACIVKENVICRRGRVIYPNGDYYQGELSGNKANGKGKLVEGKVTYNGDFKDNLPHGKGVEKGEGYTFEGQFQAGQKKHGTLIWKRDEQTLTYKGQFYNNLFHGRGTLITKDNRYMGEFQKGEKSGEGKLYYNNHRYYEGQFKNDKRHGQGKIIDEQKTLIVQRGRWEDDIFVE